MRAALVLLVLATLPFAPQAAASAAYAGQDSCFAGGGRVLGFGAAYPGCSVSHDGAVSFVACDGTTCAFLVSVSALARGMPLGARSIATSVDDSLSSTSTRTVCAASDVATSAQDLPCAGSVETTLIFGAGDCRFMSIETLATGDHVVSGGRILSEFRICLTETGATFEAI